MEIIRNVAIGGAMGGAVPAGDLAYTMEVDYVRVFQQGSAFEAGDVLSAVQNNNNAALLQSVAAASIARTEFDLAQVRKAVDAADISTVQGVDALFTAAHTGAMQRLAGTGIDLVDLDEALVDALAGADVGLADSFTTGTLQATAAADAADKTAWIRASLRDLIEVGIDRVLLPAATDEAVLALRDKADNGSSVDLSGLPFFVRYSDQDVALVLANAYVAPMQANAPPLQAFAAPRHTPPPPVPPRRAPTHAPRLGVPPP